MSVNVPSSTAGAVGRREFVSTLVAMPLLALGGFAAPAAADPDVELATFAGGCFWCMEPPFDNLGDAVLSTTSGYCGGREENPTYKQVSAGRTNHAESLQVAFNPKKISYEKLLDVYWHQIDPTTKDRQFCDTGHQYRTAIFYHSEEQREAAEASKATYEAKRVFDKPIVTEIKPLIKFWPAEDYHQDYYIKSPQTYYYYRELCGRDRYLKQQWGPEAAAAE